MSRAASWSGKAGDQQRQRFTARGSGLGECVDEHTRVSSVQESRFMYATGPPSIQLSTFDPDFVNSRPNGLTDCMRTTRRGCESS